MIAGIALGWTNPGGGSPPAGFGGFRAGTGANRGNLGIGFLSADSDPASLLGVKGGAAIGLTYGGSQAPTDGLIVEGSLGIGTSTPRSAVAVDGGVAIGGVLQQFFPEPGIPRENTVTSYGGNLQVSHAALTIGSDGFPIFGYTLDSGGTLYFTRCTSLDCAATEPPIQIDSSAAFPSVAISSLRTPMMSYVKGGDLRFAMCADIRCAFLISGTPVSLVLASSDVTSLTVGQDGFPVIAYKTNGGGLGFVHCGNSTCTSGYSSITIDSEASAFASIAIGSDGFPVIAYYGSAQQNLKVAHCKTLTCSGSPSPVLSDIDTTGDVGQYASLTIGNDGYPLIAYYDLASGLKLAKCKDVGCAQSAFTVLDSGTLLGKYPSIAIGPDGNPLVAYYRGRVPHKIKVAKCGAPDCAIAWPLDVQATDVTPPYVSAAIGVDGLPIIAFVGPSKKLTTLKCGSENCVPYWVRR